jgi:hypothetical protein
MAAIIDPWVYDRIRTLDSEEFAREEPVEPDDDSLDDNALNRLGINTGEERQFITGVDLARSVSLTQAADTMLTLNTTQGVMRVDSEMVVDGTLDVTGSLMYNGSLIDELIQERIDIEVAPLETLIHDQRERLEIVEDQLRRLLEDNGQDNS